MNLDLSPEEQKEHLLCKLKQIFKDGYCPVRQNESYNVELKKRIIYI